MLTFAFIVAAGLLLGGAMVAVAIVALRGEPGPAATPGVDSRTERLVGQRAQVTEPIDPVLGTGRVVVAGDDWSARSDRALPSGTEVRIDGHDGIVLQVSPWRSQA